MFEKLKEISKSYLLDTVKFVKANDDKASILVVKDDIEEVFESFNQSVSDFMNNDEAISTYLGTSLVWENIEYCFVVDDFKVIIKIYNEGFELTEVNYFYKENLIYEGLTSECNINSLTDTMFSFTEYLRENIDKYI